MMAGRSELPLEKDSAARLLPWIIAVMVYLAALATAGAMVLYGAVSGWSTSLSGTLTVQIPAAPSGDAETRERVARVAKILRATKGIARVDVLDTKRLSALVRPWLGPDAGKGDLPLPRLIDVTVDRGARIDLALLSRRLAQAVPGASVEDHQKWLLRLKESAQVIGIVSLVMVLLTAVAAAITVVFATRTGLQVHHGITEVLHLIGARDQYIAKQFQRQAFFLGLKGGVIGVVLAVGTILLIGRSIGQVRAFGLTDVTLSVAEWLVLAALPLVASLVAMVTARYTVLRTLGKML